VRAGLAAETDATFLLGARAGSVYDRPLGDRQSILEQALEAWRVNPLARRLVELTSQYAVGGGSGCTANTRPQRVSSTLSGINASTAWGAR
jgi:hypothetical protein